MSSKNSLRVKLCQKRIVIMLYLGILRDVGNVILSPTVLIYEIEKDNLILYLTRTGTHSDLFKK